MRQYNFGDCVPISELAYKRLKKKGYNSILIAGYVTVLEGEYCDKFDHTWIICGKHRIDLTKNQFDIYGGIDEYLKPKFYYIIKGKKFIIRSSLRAIKKEILK